MLSHDNHMNGFLLLHRRISILPALLRPLSYSQLDYFNKKDMGTLMVSTSDWPCQGVLSIFCRPLITSFCVKNQRGTMRDRNSWT